MSRLLRFLALPMIAFVACAACLWASSQADPKRQVLNDEFLENLVGKWSIVRTIRGTEVKNLLDVEWVLNHQFLQLHMKDASKPAEYEAIVLIGYQESKKRYVAHWTDTYGGEFSALGYGQRQGDKIEFEFQYPDGPFFNTFEWNAKDKVWTFVMESSDGKGKRSLFATDKLKR